MSDKPKKKAGRPRRYNSDLPDRVYVKHGSYYYVDFENRWTRLSKEGDKSALYEALSRMLGTKRMDMSAMFERYENEILPQRKSLQTYKKQKKQLEKLNTTFGHMFPEQIQPVHIAGYLDKRSAKVAANREIALLSNVFRKVIRWGYAKINPCSVVERNKEKPRKRYVGHEEFQAVYSCASLFIQVMMDLAYLTGQRQADLLKIKSTDLREQGIYVQQGKTDARIIIQWSDDLRQVIQKARELQTEAEAIVYVVGTRRGHPYTTDGFRAMWRRHLLHCQKEGLIEEWFTFHDLRAKARSDGEDKKLLGHANPDAMDRVYQRKPTLVKPVKRPEY